MEKRPVGRPPGKKYDAEFNVRLEQTVLDELIRLADKANASKSEMARKYIRAGIANDDS